MPLATLSQNSLLIKSKTSLSEIALLDLFSNDAKRVDNFSCDGAGLHLDYSKNALDAQTLSLLIDAANDKNLSDKIKSLITGEPVNYTEKRPALHTALRFAQGTPVDKRTAVQDVHKDIQRFVEKVHTGSWVGHTGKPISDVVNIGIGGSDLGPSMVNEALRAYRIESIRCHYVSNVDAADILGLLEDLNPETTLFVIASKTFTTLETLTNANTARNWLEAGLSGDVDVAKHFVATTSNIEKAVKFGINEENIFPMWDWVGGRYSLWSSIGLPIALGFGFDNFIALLTGAKEMDDHFSSAPFEQNMPVILGLIGIWYNNYWNAQTQAIIPYSHDLRLFPKYLQQLDMESNGKSATLSGDVEYNTGPIVWGEAGTNGQHSFHQLLHQGTCLVPIDFIAPLQASHDLQEHQTHLFANCLSQSYALMVGKSHEQAKQEFLDAGYEKSDAEKLAQHKVMSGNRPSNTIVMDKLTPKTLGALIALYEHKVFVQSVMWDINPFDQWGVELGKKISTLISQVISDDEDGHDLDPSTQQLIRRFQASLAQKG